MGKVILLITSAKGGPSTQGGPSTPQPEAAVVLKLAARVVVYQITTKLSKIKQLLTFLSYFSIGSNVTVIVISHAELSGLQALVLITVCFVSLYLQISM